MPVSFLHDYSYIKIPTLSLVNKTLIVSYTGSASGKLRALVGLDVGGGSPVCISTAVLVALAKIILAQWRVIL